MLHTILYLTLHQILHLSTLNPTAPFTHKCSNNLPNHKICHFGGKLPYQTNTLSLPQLWSPKCHYPAPNLSTPTTLVPKMPLSGTKPQHSHNFGPQNAPIRHQTSALSQLWSHKCPFSAPNLSTLTTLVPKMPLSGTKHQQPHNYGPTNAPIRHQISATPQLWSHKCHYSAPNISNPTTLVRDIAHLRINVIFVG